MKKKYLITIFCAFVLIISTAGVYAWQTQEEKNIKTDMELKAEENDKIIPYHNDEEVKIKENDVILPYQNDGDFYAEIGIEKNKEPLYYLNGNYQKENKILTCEGTVISGEQEGVFTGIFKGCKKTYFEIKIIFDEEPIIFEGSYKFEKNKEDFQGLWWKDNKCFDFVYPISYMMPDGTIITGNSEEEINQLIKVWYKEHPDEKEKPVLQYPVDIIYEDGTIVTINNDEEMKNAYENCGDKEWGWITGSFQGMENDNGAKNIPNDIAKFPILSKLFHIVQNIFLRIQALINL